MALELNLHPRTIWVAQQLARRPEFYWENLDYEDKLRVYRAPIELDAVPDHLVEEFEREMALEGELGVEAQIKAMVGERVSQLTQ